MRLWNRRWLALGLASVANVISPRRPKGATEVNGLIYEKILLESQPGIVVPVRVVTGTANKTDLP